MEAERFDRLTQSLSRSRSRRGTLQALAGGLLGAAGLVLLGEDPAAARNKNKKSGKGRGHRRGGKKRTRAQAAAGCCGGTNCTPGTGKNLAKCDFEDSSALKGKNLKGSNLSGANLRGGDASGANATGVNLGNACLVDANLANAKLTNTNTSGAIFCRTTMPNGAVNNSGCEAGTNCCPTCVPIGESRCNLGGSCCGGAVCSGAGDGVCACPAGLTNCSGVCRDLTNDARNCNACGARCPSGETCQGGQCRCGAGASCAAGLTCCSGQCVDLLTDLNNCTACGNACPASLPNSEIACGIGLDENDNERRGCTFTCGANFLDCNNDPSDGCEVDVSNNNFNCGTCSPTNCASVGKVCKGCRCLDPGPFSTICQDIRSAKLIRPR